MHLLVYSRTEIHRRIRVASNVLQFLVCRACLIWLRLSLECVFLPSHVEEEGSRPRTSLLGSKSCSVVPSPNFHVDSGSRTAVIHKPQSLAKTLTSTSTSPSYGAASRCHANSKTQLLASETYYSVYNHELSRSSRSTTSLNPLRCRRSASSSQILPIRSNSRPRLPRRDHSRGSLRHNPPQAIRRRKNLSSRGSCDRGAMYGPNRPIPEGTWRYHTSGGTATGLYKTAGF